MFVEAQPYSNFTLNSEGDWISPVGTPEDLDASGNFVVIFHQFDLSGLMRIHFNVKSQMNNLGRV